MDETPIPLENKPKDDRAQGLHSDIDDLHFSKLTLEDAKKREANEEIEEPGKKTLQERNQTKQIITSVENANYEENLLVLNLPKNFAYTGVIDVNNFFQGLLHSFIRHFEQWQTFIPELCFGTQLDSILPLLENIHNEDFRDENRKIKKLIKNLKWKMPYNHGIHSEFLEAQKRIVEFIHEKIQQENYIEDGANIRGPINVHFIDPEGNIQIMVLKVSKQLYPMVKEFQDARPVRTILSISFVDWDLKQSSFPREEEDGIEADSYEIDVYFTGFELQNKDYYRLNQEPQIADKSIVDICKFTPSSEVEKTESVLRNPIKLSAEMCKPEKSWLEVKMPSSEFVYTCAIMMHDAKQGLLHSLLRHWNQWIEHFPDFENLVMEKLKPIQNELKHIRDAPNHRTALDAIDDLYAKIGIEKLESINELQAALSVAQFKIHQIIEKYLKSSKVIEEGVNFKNKIIVHFEINDNKQQMVLGVSKQLFCPVKENHDERPIRFITTVFFNQQQFAQNIRQLGISLTEYADPTVFQMEFGTETRDQDVSIRNAEIFRDFENSDFENGEPNGNNFDNFIDLLIDRSLLHVRMPYYFGHTCAIMTNSICGGLLHTIAGHTGQWYNYIQGYRNMMRVIMPLLNQINRINRRQIFHNFTNNLTHYYDMYRNDMGNAAWQEIRRLQWFLMKTQMKIYRFIQNCVMTGEYCGERQNDNQDIQIIFSVPNELVFGRNRVHNHMALCVSDEYYPPRQVEFSHHRHFRTIITVFFGNYNTSRLSVTWRPPRPVFTYNEADFPNL